MSRRGSFLQSNWAPANLMILPATQKKAAWRVGPAQVSDLGADGYRLFNVRVTGAKNAKNILDYSVKLRHIVMAFEPTTLLERYATSPTPRTAVKTCACPCATQTALAFWCARSLAGDSRMPN
jgi:hypothetical protein